MSGWKEAPTWEYRVLEELPLNEADAAAGLLADQEVEVGSDFTRGNLKAQVRRLVIEAPDESRVVLLTDVSDDEKPLLMRGCAAYALPTRPEPDFVETFGIALTEKMLAGGGPVITTTSDHQDL